MPQATPLNELIVNINSRVQGQYSALCPAHDDINNPSLSVKVDGDKVLWNCFAGCSKEEVQAALVDAGMQWGKPKETSKKSTDYLPPAGDDDPHGSFFDYQNKIVKPEKETTHEAIFRDVELGLAVAGGSESDFLKNNGERLIGRINALHWKLSIETTLNMWLLGRILNMFKDGRDDNGAKLVPHGLWGHFLEKNKLDVNRAQRAMRIHKGNTWDEIQGKKTQNQALGKSCKQDTEETHNGGESTPEYQRGGDRQREVETICALRHENKRLKTELERRDTDIERWKQDAQKWEAMYREVTKAEFEAGGIPYGDPPPTEIAYN